MVLRITMIVVGLFVALWMGAEAWKLIGMTENHALERGFFVLGLMFVSLAGAGVLLYKNLRSSKSGHRIALFVIASALIAPMASGCTNVTAGHVGIKVKYAGSQRGVEDIPVVTGWATYWPGAETIITFPTFVQTAVWTKNVNEGHPINEELSFNSLEGTPFTADISFSYQLKPDKAPEFYVKFRADDLDKFTNGYVKNVVRDLLNEVAGRHRVEEIYGEKKEVILKEVRERLRKELSPYGLEILQFGFIEAPRPPQQVIDALNAKVAATQDAMRTENELRRSRAEAAKVAAKARGEAEANKALGSSITPQLLQWRMMQITEEAVQKWNGQRPLVEGGDKGMLLQLPMPQLASISPHSSK